MKWALAVLAISFLAYEMFIKRDAVSLLRSYRDIITHNMDVLLLVIALMPLNWLIDAVKWKWLLKPYAKLSVASAFRGVFMGITVGLFTPNGVGEFMGRLWVVSEDKREQAASTSIVGSMAQLAITITIGGACLVFYIGDFILPRYVIVNQVLAVATVVLGFFLYFKLPAIASGVLTRLPFLQRFSAFIASFKDFDLRSLGGAYVFAFLRYIVFCTQLALLLFALGELTLAGHWSLLFLIPVYYYVQALVPTVALSEIGVRGMILSFLFSPFLFESDVILVSFLIWVINLIIPGLIGLFFLLKAKIEARK